MSVEPIFDVMQHPAAISYAAKYPERQIQIFGPYLLLETLGNGRFGEVELGLNASTGEMVAVKLISNDAIDDDKSAKQRIEREIEVLKSLCHPNVVRLCNVIKTKNHIGIVLNYASGGSLSDYIQAHHFLHDDNARELFAQLIGVVKYLHAKKITHYNLDVTNLLLDSNGDIFVTSFGFANYFGASDDALTYSGLPVLCCTPPEFKGDYGPHVEGAVDIWSCGVILYTMLAGSLPFSDASEAPGEGKAQKLYWDAYDNPLIFPSNVPSETRGLLEKMLVVHPSYRATLKSVIEHPWLASYSDLLGRSVEENERIAREIQLLKPSIGDPGSKKLGPRQEMDNRREHDYESSQARLSTIPLSTTRESLLEESSQAEPVDNGVPITIPLEELMAQTSLKDLTGQVYIPDYRRPIHGGFAMVFTGLWNNKRVAVKLLKASKNLKKPAPWEATMERRLTREINVWSALAHPNILEFLGFSSDLSDFPAMISTWCELGTARDYLLENVAITTQGRLRLIQDVVEGLEYLHGLKIVHGDLKPTNILIDDSHVARLCDFGLVRLDDWQGPAGMTTTSPYTGTDRYKSHELFISSENRYPISTFEGDMYAFGCIGLEFVEGKVPFQQYTGIYELAEAIKGGEPPGQRPKRTSTQSMQFFWNLIEACWSWYPENRPNVNEAVKELARILGLI